MKRILGLDTGTNSLGWAVVDKHENGTYELIRKGSLIFQEGVKIEKGIESSKAAERTGHRALRKQYFRRRLRKIEVLKVLIKYNLCPKLTDEDLNIWHTKKIYPKNDDFMLWQRTSDNENKNPYYYRHVCLHEVLDLDDKDDAYILGRALYHLAQRRGFLSNRLDNSDESEDSGKVKEGISALTEAMNNAGCDYLGDYFFSLYNSDKPKKIRSQYTDREEHYKKEFYAICDKQQLPTELINELVGQIIKYNFKIMKGSYGRYLYMMLSFIPWYLCSFLTCGLSYIWTHPYIYSTYTNFYLDLVTKRKQGE